MHQEKETVEKVQLPLSHCRMDFRLTTFWKCGCVQFRSRKHVLHCN